MARLAAQGLILTVRLGLQPWAFLATIQVQLLVRGHEPGGWLMRGSTSSLIGFLALIGLIGAFVLASPAVSAEVNISINKTTQRMTVTVDGEERYSWPVSTGMAGYATPTGAFTPSRLEKEHYSREWDDAPMPHSIFFTEAGHAIHGSHAIRRLGTPASHGCVRIAPTNASRLFNLVMAEGLGNTRIEVIGVDPIGAGLERGSGTEGEFRRLTAFDPLAVGIMAGAHAVHLRANTSESP
jgi:hypothetical protein